MIAWSAKLLVHFVALELVQNVTAVCHWGTHQKQHFTLLKIT